jgi:hypothetical protein
MNRLLLTLGLAGLLSACGGPAADPSATPAAPPHPGKSLHTLYCGSCHAIPEPGELDKKTWRDHILVRMGAYMGIYNDNTRYYDSVPSQWIEPGLGGERVRAAGVYPSKAVLSRQEWEQLRDYVLSMAPERTSGPPNMLPIAPTLPGFKAHVLQPDTVLQPLVTAVAIDTQAHQLYAAFIQQEILRLTPDGKVQGRQDGIMGPVQILPRPQGLSVIDIGSMGGSDTPKGQFLSATSLSGLRKPATRMTELQRPVFAEYGDLDQDGDQDILLCEFGYHIGELSWQEQTAPGRYTRHTLYTDDGAVCARIHDFTGDGLPDLLVLLANADERIDLYVNQGNGEFKRQLVERFSPVNGSTYLELVDWDKDGAMDFLLVNGDNGDYPPILKASHGIRLYRNQGGLKFKETFHLGMNGAYGLRARDFDQDGDYDIAAVAFYPDYAGRPAEAFTYYQNQGGNQFKAMTFPESNLGRWMVMDAGDLDGDGDLDIALGAFDVKSGDAADATYEGWIRNNVPLIWLENTLKN